MAKICSTKDCEKPVSAKGLCRFHYHKKYKEENKERLFEQNKKYVEKNKERYKAQHKLYREAHKEESKEYGEKYRLDNKEKLNADSRQYHHKNREVLLPQMRIRGKRLREDYKREAFTKYSNGKIMCKICHIEEIEFLTLDHINNEGAKHRKKIKNGSIYKWLKKHDYPPICQVLCMNCNFLKQLNENKKKWLQTYSAITNRKSKNKIQLEVFSKVSKKVKPVCACCHYSDLRALSLDHISGRKNTPHPKITKWGKKPAGMEFWRWLKKHDYPPICQVLCMNCNYAKRDNPECPHQLKKV